MRDQPAVVPRAPTEEAKRRFGRLVGVIRIQECQVELPKATSFPCHLLERAVFDSGGTLGHLVLQRDQGLELADRNVCQQRIAHQLGGDQQAATRHGGCGHGTQELMGHHGAPEGNQE